MFAFLKKRFIFGFGQSDAKIVKDIRKQLYNLPVAGLFLLLFGLGMFGIYSWILYKIRGLYTNIPQGTTGFVLGSMGGFGFGFTFYIAIYMITFGFSRMMGKANPVHLLLLKYHDRLVELGDLSGEVEPEKKDNFEFPDRDDSSLIKY